MANEQGTALFDNPSQWLRLVCCGCISNESAHGSFWGKASMKVTILRVMCNLLCKECFLDSRSLELERKVGGKVCPKLNIGLTPIVNKYPEGNVKRTLERKLKVFEIAEKKAKGIYIISEIAVCVMCSCWWFNLSRRCLRAHVQRVLLMVSASSTTAMMPNTRDLIA